MTLSPSDPMRYGLEAPDVSGPTPLAQPTPETVERRDFIPTNRTHWRGINLRDDAQVWLMEHDPLYWSGRKTFPPEGV